MNQDSFLLPDHCDNLGVELQRRLMRETKAPPPTAPAEKWIEQHTNLAEQLNVRWPLKASSRLAASEWYQTLPPREQQARLGNSIVLAATQALCFVEVWNQKLAAQQKSTIAFADLSQSISRMPTSTRASKAVCSVELTLACRWFQPFFRTRSSGMSERGGLCWVSAPKILWQLPRLRPRNVSSARAAAQ